MAKCDPGNSQSQILWAILRKTYGWHKKEDQISIDQLAEMTGISRRMVIYSLQNLEAKRMVIIIRKRGRGKKNEINTISFQKNYEKWIVQEKSDQYKKVLEKRKLAYQKSKGLVVQEKISSARNPNLVVQEIEKNSGFLAPTKETTKDNTKDIYGEFQNVKLSKEEYQKLVDRFTEPGTKDRIEILSQYIASKGKKYSSHYATLLTWERKNPKPIAKPQQPPPEIIPKDFVPDPDGQKKIQKIIQSLAEEKST